MSNQLTYEYDTYHVREVIGGSIVKNPPANAGDKGDVSSVPG